MATTREALRVSKALSSIDGPQNYAVGGKWKPELPLIEVQGVGDLYLPVSIHAVRQLILVAKRAPVRFSSGHTVDPDQRRVWMLDGSKISFRNESFYTCLDRLVAHAATMLGARNTAFHAYEIESLLIYEPGDFSHSSDEEHPKGSYATLQISIPTAQTGHKVEVSYGDWSHTFEDDKPGEVFNWCAYFDDTNRKEHVLGTGSRLVLSLRLYNSTARDDLESGENAFYTPSAALLAAKMVDLVQPLITWSKRPISDAEVAPHVPSSPTPPLSLAEADFEDELPKGIDSEQIYREASPKLDSKLQKAFGAEYEQHKKTQAELRLEATELAKKKEEHNTRTKNSLEKSRREAHAGEETSMGETRFSLDDRVLLPSPLLWTLKHKPMDDNSKVLLSFDGDTFSDCALQLRDEDWGVFSSLKLATHIIPNVSVNLMSIQIRKHYFAIPGEHDPALSSKQGIPPTMTEISTNGSGIRWEPLSWRLDAKNPTEIKARVIEAMHPGIVLPTQQSSMTFEPLQSEADMLDMLQPELDVCHPFVEEYSSSPQHSPESSTDSDSPTVSRFVDGGEFSPHKLHKKERTVKTRTVYRRTLLFTRLALFIFRFNPEHPDNKAALERRAGDLERGIGSGDIPDLISTDASANHFVISERPKFASQKYKDQNGVARALRSRTEHLHIEKEDERVERQLKRSTSLDYDRMQVQFAKIDVSNDVVEREPSPPPNASSAAESDPNQEKGPNEGAASSPDAVLHRVPSVVITCDDESASGDMQTLASSRREESSMSSSSSHSGVDSPSSSSATSKRTKKKKVKEVKKEKEEKKKVKEAKEAKREKEKKSKK